MHPTLLFIDLDDTLVHNDHTKNVLVACLEEVGFDKEAIETAYAFAREESGFFTPMAYLRALNASPEQIARWDQSWQTHRQGIANGLFPGAVEFLQGIDRTRYTPILLTLGDPTYQQDKFSILNLDQYFTTHHFCTEPKEQFLAKIVPQEEAFILIDDRADCRQAVEVTFPYAKTYATFAAFTGASN